MVNVMIVEDQKLVRSILESYIKKEEGYELLSSIPGADRAADICDACRIDLILMDVQTERRENGLAAVEKIKASHPEIKIVVVTSLVDCEVLRRAREAGADSLWYKDTDEELLMEAVRRTMAGGAYIPGRAASGGGGHGQKHGIYQRRDEGAALPGERYVVWGYRRGAGYRGDDGEVPCLQHAAKDQSGKQAPARHNRKRGQAGGGVERKIIK